MCNQCGHCIDSPNQNNKTIRKTKSNKQKKSLFKENGEIITQIEYDIACVIDALEIANNMYKNFDDNTMDYHQNELINISSVNSKDDIVHLFVKLNSKYEQLRMNLRESKKSQEQKNKDMDEYEKNFRCSHSFG